MVCMHIERLVTSIRPIYAFVLIFATGCHGDAELPLVSSTRIPNTRLSVHLGGPDSKGIYGYSVMSSSGTHYGYRALGRLEPDQMAPVTLESLGDGRFRIEWGTPPTAQYAIIDVRNKRFVEDSNAANRKDEPFAEY